MKKLPKWFLGALFMLFLTQTVVGQANLFASVGLDDIQSTALSAAKINGSATAANQLPGGTVVVYKTGEGRYGKLAVRSNGYNLAIDFLTYNLDGTIFKQGTNLVIRGTYQADLDLGKEVNKMPGADFWWEQVNKTDRFFVPLNNTMAAVYKFPDYLITLSNAPTVVQPGQELGNNMIVQVRETMPGVPARDIAIDLVLVSRRLYPVPAPYAVYTPEYKEGLLLKGGREFVRAGFGMTPVKLNGSNTIPLDMPGGMYFLAAVVDAGNKAPELNEANNVAYWPIRVEVPDLFASIDLADIKANGVFSSRINGSNNRMNQIPTGTIVVYKTNEGRYGKFKVKSYDYNLLIDLVTYNPNGTIFNKGVNLNVRGTWSCDLDKGMETEKGAGADFWWEQANSIERYLVPQNGALMAVYRQRAM